MKTVVWTLAVLLLAALPGCAGGNGSAATTQAVEPAVRHTLTATSRCLRAKGATIRRLRPLDPRLRAMRDLAQRTSHEVRVRGKIVGVAFQRDEADARLLLELLRVPNDPYRLVRDGNVVVMSRKPDRAAHATVVGCLRP